LNHLRPDPVPVATQYSRMIDGLRFIALTAGLLLAFTSAGSTTVAAAEASPKVFATEPIPSGVALKVLNREVFVFRGHFGDYAPDQRAAAAMTLIDRARRLTDEAQVEAAQSGSNMAIRINGQTVFMITPGDVLGLEEETQDLLAERTTRRLRLVMEELREMGNHRSLLWSGAKALAATVLLGGMVWVLSRNRRWFEGRLIKLTAAQADQIKSQTLRLLGLQNVVPMLRGLSRCVFWSIILIAGYLWMEYLLRLFPHTRPFGEQLGRSFFQLVGGFGQGFMHALPSLGLVVLIWILARFATSSAGRYFAAIARGTIHSHLFDSATALMTQRVCVFMIWIIAIIVAFPYIPGSQTPAFQGISVLAGLMITVGSGSLIAQLVGGLVVVYNRNCRVGDYVRVGEHEGTLTQIGFFSSRMTTIRNEEVVLPNSQLSSGILINYTKLNESLGVSLPVNVSIGYGTPWRQVHALLLEAAARTEGVRKEPPPKVIQKALADFYIEYQLNAALDDPARRVEVLSRLHANIQDAFNEAGVQIMSPHYRSDPPAPVFVPKERWHAEG
jgi:small-conductance mechanosensitive channel